MKTTKQISFVVICTLVFGMFSITAFANTTNTESTVKSTTTTTSTTAPAVTATAPAVTTTAPAVTTTAPAVKTTAPAVTTTAPAVTTTTPAATTTTPAATTTTPAVTTTTPAVKAPEKATAAPTASKVLVNGKVTTFEAYNIGGNNYFKLRDLASAVNGSNKQFEIAWDASKNAIDLKANTAYTKVGGEMSKSDGKAKNAILSTSKVYKDGTELTSTAYNIGGNNFFKLRDVAKAFNIGVTWDSKTNTIGIDTSIDYSEK